MSIRGVVVWSVAVAARYFVPGARPALAGPAYPNAQFSAPSDRQTVAELAAKGAMIHLLVESLQLAPLIGYPPKWLLVPALARW